MRGRPGHAHTPESRAAVSRGLRRYHELRREEGRVKPRDLLALAAPGSAIPANVRAYAEGGGDDSARLRAAKGGDLASEPESMAIEDFGRLGAVLRGTLALWAQTQDPELASRIATLVNARRSLLALLGLERLEKSVEPLDAYLARTAQAPVGRANGGAPEPADVPVTDPAGAGSGEAE